MRLLIFAFGTMVGATIATSATAQVTGNIAIDSDYRLRGNSLTNDHPALSAQLSYDHPSGAYAGLSGLAEIGGDTRFLGVVGNIGYAKRVDRHLTLDAGLLRSQIGAAVPGSAGFHYSEVYAGAYVGPLSARISYSPDYRTGSQSTVYGELEAGFEPVAKWRLSGHVGLLTYLNSSALYRSGEARQDLSISLARQLDRFELRAVLSEGGSSTDYGYRPDRTAKLAFGAGFSF